MAKSNVDVNAIFDNLDYRKRNYLSIEDLRNVSSDLSNAELEYIFKQMDLNNDGKLSRDEFVQSFERVIAKGEKSGYRGLQRRASMQLGNSPMQRPRTLITQAETVYHSDPDAELMENIPCQEEVLQLYEQLQAAGVPAVLSQFEKVIGNFCKEIKEQKDQTDRLQKIYEREKDTHSKHLSEVEVELDKHLEIAEEKARKNEREKLEKEKDEMRRSLEGEIGELQYNISKLQRMEEMLNAKSKDSGMMHEIKQKMEDMGSENKHLRNNLTQNQIEMAVIKSELAQMRNEYDTKCMEMINEKEQLLEFVHEKDTAIRQLQLLYDANKRLHDTNDNLRSALESRSNVCKQFNLRSPSPRQLQQKLSSSKPGTPTQFLTPSQSRQAGRLTGDNTDTDNDIGRFTQIDSGFARTSNCSIGRRSGFESEGLSSDHSTDLDHYMVQSSTGAGARTSDIESVHSKSSKRVPKPGKVTGPAERTFRVVLAGDASVGKSSVIMRLISGQFVDSLPSTLGVDFHVKLMNVDGKNVAVQLWDTAGQERFRSLSKSYFRRADGALLIYDCTCEQSFVNVRSWMETITESAARVIPVFLCANKTDLRVLASAEGKRCISKEEGQKLAKNYSAIYHETSAKEGTNIEVLAREMVRELLAHEDVEISTSSLVLRTGTNTSQGESTGRCSGGQRRCT